MGDIAKSSERLKKAGIVLKPSGGEKLVGDPAKSIKKPSPPKVILKRSVQNFILNHHPLQFQSLQEMLQQDLQLEQVMVSLKVERMLLGVV